MPRPRLLPAILLALATGLLGLTPLTSYAGHSTPTGHSARPVGASRAASASVHVRAGSAPESALFPSNRFTVPDARQRTGRRVALPTPHCTAQAYSACDDVTLLNTLDGFDLQPRISIPFTGPIDLNSINGGTVHVDGPDGPQRLLAVVYDPSNFTVTGTPENQLREQTTYRITVTGDVLDASEHRIGRGASTTFTTVSATTELDGIRRSLDSGAAYRQAGIGSRAVSFTQGATTTVFPVAEAGAITRLDQTKADPHAPLVSSSVPAGSVAGVACFAFGSFASPQFVTSSAVIPPAPSTQTPAARGKATIGFSMVVPAGITPPGGWPVAVYGPGFTRSYFDLFLTADENAALGVATLSIDPLGHGFGPGSKVSVAGTSFLSYGRGHDLNGDGNIDSSEGVQPTDHVTMSGGKVVADTPSRDALVGDRDGLIQTVADNMAAVRAVEHGISVPTCGGRSVPLARSGVQYYGLSFGGIYGTMLLGTDTHVADGFLNVGGGPIVDIARLGGFRYLLAHQLQVNSPSLLNGGPGVDGFTEDLPLLDDPRVSHPHPGAIAVQNYLSHGAWYERAGSPESYAPLLRLRPRYYPKTVEFLNAFGDDTVPNPTTGNVIRAGKLLDRISYYRNDLTPTMGRNPHGFLEDPTLTGREMAEISLGAFLQSRGRTVLDPDGPAPVFETPIKDPTNLLCTHVGEPQNGATAYPPPAAGPCPPIPADPYATAASR